MSLIYSMEFDASFRISDVVDRLDTVPGFKLADGTVSAQDLEIFTHIREPSDLKCQVIEESFFFHPSVVVSFRLNALGDRFAGRHRIIQATLTLLECSSGDAVLLFNGETVMFQRLDGRLTLNRVEGFWTSEALDMVPRPYECDEIPII